MGTTPSAITLGLPDSQVNYTVAHPKATQIELDIVSGNFDPTLKKYKPQRTSQKFTSGNFAGLFETLTKEEQKTKSLCTEWYRASLSCPCFACQHQHCHQRIKKKEHLLQQVNLLTLKQLNPKRVEVEICLAKVPPKHNGPESGLDEMWSYVTKKKNQRWLWHATEHHNGKILLRVWGS